MSYWDEEKVQRGKAELYGHGKGLLGNIPGVSHVIDAAEWLAKAPFRLSDDQRENLFLIRNPETKKVILRQCGVPGPQMDKMEVLPTWPDKSTEIIKAMITRLGGVAYKVTAQPVGVEEKRKYWVWHQNPRFDAVVPHNDYFVKEGGVARHYMTVPEMNISAHP